VVTENNVSNYTYWVYDGYNAIAKYTRSNGASEASLAKTYYWGDKLLVERDAVSGEDFFPITDGNKNITEYLDSTGAVVMHQQYDAFGKVLVSSGSKKDEVDYGFSSEVVDRDLGLSYYNFRYYDANQGRWLSRDPIAEAGGMNVYGMVDNDAVGSWDYLGLADNKSGWDSEMEAVKAVAKLLAAATKKSVEAGEAAFKKDGHTLEKMQPTNFYTNDKNYTGFSTNYKEKVSDEKSTRKDVMVWGGEYGAIVYSKNEKWFHTRLIRGKLPNVEELHAGLYGTTDGNARAEELLKLIDLEKSSDENCRIHLVHSHNVKFYLKINEKSITKISKPNLSPKDRAVLKSHEEKLTKDGKPVMKVSNSATDGNKLCTIRTSEGKETCIDLK